jgi:tRNA threonylcarbamoyladenosine biosynthesis protein TsaB
MAHTILSLATITGMCSVGVWREKRVLVDHQCWLGARHAEKLLPMVAAVMKESGLTFWDLDKIAVAKGPGSFTGIRIGLAAARGLALATSKPLVGVNSLEAIAHGVCSQGRAVLAVLDAKRGQVYAQSFSPEGRWLGLPLVVAPADIGRLMLPGQYTVAGTGLNLVRPYLAELMEEKFNFVFDETEGLPRASDVARAARFRKPEFADTGGATPIYLRPLDAMPPSAKNSGAQDG